MENEMKDAEEKIDEIKQEKELLFVSGRRTHLERPDRLEKDEMNAEQMPPKTRKKSGNKYLIVYFCH